MDWSFWYCPLSGLWNIQLTVTCLSHSPLTPPAPPSLPTIVHHQTSTILTSVEEISCQAFILLRDQGPSCSYLNITLLRCRFEMTGAGGISFMRALKTQNASAWPLGFGGIIWWIRVLQQLLVRSHQGSKSGCVSPPSIVPYGHFHFSLVWKLAINPFILKRCIAHLIQPAIDAESFDSDGMEKKTCDTSTVLCDRDHIKLHPKLNVLNPVSESIKLILCMSALIRISCKTTMQHLLGHWRFWFMRQGGPQLMTC